MTFALHINMNYILMTFIAVYFPFTCINLSRIFFWKTLKFRSLFHCIRKEIDSFFLIILKLHTICNFWFLYICNIFSIYFKVDLFANLNFKLILLVSYQLKMIILNRTKSDCTITVIVSRVQQLRNQVSSLKYS